MRVPILVSILAAAALSAAPARAQHADAAKTFRYAFQVAETSFDPAEVSAL